jgi:2-polyprenyl-3-methyl-5-hydroxy-6-metoxy-1,4-benzoquinol methylase
MISLNNKPCEICRETRSELAWTTVWPEHRYPGEFSMRRCLSCGLLFNSPRLDDEQLGQLYGRNYYFFHRKDPGEIARIVPMYLRTVALVASQVDVKRSLDIGCGRGYLPAVMKHLGWDSRAVEISPAAGDYARQRFGIDVFSGTVEQYARSPQAGTFPLVTAIDVIEHVPSPRSFIEAIARIVEPGGRLIIDTPNAAAHNIQVKGTEWQGFNPFHIYLFTVQNLKRLLEQHGCTVDRGFSYHNVALDQHPEPPALRLRNALARNLKRAGLAAPAAKLYFTLKGLAARDGPAQPHLDRAAECIRSLPPWTDSPDAVASLAKHATGDNLVVIARRTA